MRIAAGVLLIIMAVGNGCVGAGATILGGASGALEDAAEEAAAQNQQEMTEAEQAQMAEGVAAIGEASGLLTIIGFYLLALFALQIAAAVMLFTRKGPMFVVIVGVLGMVPVVLSLIGGGGLNIVYVISLAVSALAIVAGLGMKKELEGGGGAPAPA